MTTIESQGCRIIMASPTVEVRLLLWADTPTIPFPHWQDQPEDRFNSEKPTKRASIVGFKGERSQSDGKASFVILDIAAAVGLTEYRRLGWMSARRLWRSTSI